LHEQFSLALERSSLEIQGLDMTRDEAIAEITHRLVEFYQPIRIYLFGSVARGDDGPDSDLDFLVVVADDAPEYKRSGRLGSRHPCRLPSCGRAGYSMTPSEARARESREWLAKADEDLASARVLIGSGHIANALFFC
jgi:hypothetical protein